MSNAKIDKHDVPVLIIAVAVIAGFIWWATTGFSFPSISIKGISIWWLITPIAIAAIIWWLAPKKGGDWKWSKAWNNTAMIATVILFLAAAGWFVTGALKAGKDVFEPYPEVKEQRNRRFEERMQSFRKDPRPKNFELNVWTTYHKDSLYYYRRGLGESENAPKLSYRSADASVRVTYVKVGNPKVTTFSWHENGVPMFDNSSDDGIGNEDWYFKVDKTCSMYWYVE